MERQRGIQSLDHALKLLKVLSENRGPLALSELARAAGMPASKVHRYLASFVAAGLATQRQKSGQYALGPFALELGLSAMDQLDLVNQVADQLGDLVVETGDTALVSIWGSFGPTVVRWERSASMFATSLGLGSALPLLNSASGKIFLSYLPRETTRPLLEREIAVRKRSDLRDIDLSRPGIKRLADDIRAHGYASVDSQYMPGLSAVSAPVTDWQGELVAAVTLISTDGTLLSPANPKIARLLAFCKGHSTQRVEQDQVD